jgi:hypothetical protein
MNFLKKENIKPFLFYAALIYVISMHYYFYSSIQELNTTIATQDKLKNTVIDSLNTIIKQNDNLTIDRVKDFESKHKYLKNSMNANKINITQYSNLMAQELNKLKN